jgi:SAM-dependent methyltransferase
MSLTKRVRRWLGPMRWGSFRRFEPASRVFGFDRGKPIDRVYIEHFLRLHAQAIHGDVLEIGDNHYTRMFGSDVGRSVVLAGSAADTECYQGDLANPESLSGIGKFDCIIATQVLNFIFDLDNAMRGLKSLLKENGVVLVTLAGFVSVSRYDAQRWGDFWRFSDMSTKELFKRHFGKEIEVISFGNLISATAMLHGLAAEELQREEIFHADPDYQLLIAVKAVRRTAAVD